MKMPVRTSSQKISIILIVLIFVFGLIDIRLYTMPLPLPPEKATQTDESIDPPKLGTTDYCIFLKFSKQDVETIAKDTGVSTDQVMRLFDETIPAKILSKRIGEPIIRLGKRASVYCINYSIGTEI